MSIPTRAVPVEDIITGERLQGLAEITVTTDAVATFHSSLPATTRAVRFPGDFRTLVVDDPARLEPLRQARSIFVYTHLVPSFAQVILPHLDAPFVLLSHNSDVAITEQWRPLVDDPRIKRWFAQNVTFAHPKLESLPIGLANAQWPHGNIAALTDVMAQNRAKQHFVYANFKIETNPAMRRPLHDFLAQLGHVTMAADKEYRAYLEEMSGYRYCVSPPGNGVDCHRTWEALYLGVVPIVATFAAEQFPDMPLMPFADGTDFHAGYLEKAYEIFETQSFNLDKLRLSWWRSRVEQAVAT